MPNATDANHPVPDAATRTADPRRPELTENLYWKGNKIYYVVSHNGRTRKGSTKTDDLKKAEAVRDKEKAKLMVGIKGNKRGVSIPTLLEEYLKHLERKDANRGKYGGKYARRTGYTVNKHILPFFKKYRAEHVGTKELNAYLDHRIAEYRADGAEEGSWIVSVNRELSYLRAAMKLGYNATPRTVEHVPKFPIDAKAEKKRARTGTVHPQQYNLLMEHLADHMKPVLPFVMYAGVREKELKWIRRVQVDWDNMIISLRAGETKDGDAREVPIVDIAVEPLKKWMRMTEEFYPNCMWLFHYNGKQIKEWRTAWDNACRRAGLQKPRLNADGSPKLHTKGKKKGQPIMENLVKFHDTRRTTITTHGRAGVTEADSMKATGHKTIEVHRAYDQDKEAATRTRVAVNTYLSGGPKVVPEPKADIDIDKLEKLAGMYEKGLLSDAEFKAAKARLL